MKDVENMLERLQRDGLWLQTAIGPVLWRPDMGALREYLLKPVREALEEADAHAMVTSYLRYFLVDNIQHAMHQAALELVALAKAKVSRDKHERGQFAQEAAETAKQTSLARLRFTGYFPKPTRGDKKEPTAAQRMRGLIDERGMFLLRLEDAITTLLREGKRPTLDKVADFMGMGSEGTGRIILGRQLQKWFGPDEPAGKILKRLVGQLKT